MAHEIFSSLIISLLPLSFQKKRIPIASFNVNIIEYRSSQEDHAKKNHVAKLVTKMKTINLMPLPERPEVVRLVRQIQVTFRLIILT